MRGLSKRLPVLFFFLIESGFAQTWIATEGPQGRYVVDISRSLSNPDSMYALAEGLFLSTNGGERWDSIGLGVCCGALGVDPLDSRRLFINFNGLPFDGNAVRHSSDLGQTWVEYDSGFCIKDIGCEAPLFAYSRSRGSAVYTTLNPAFIIRSTNGGADWEVFSVPPAVGLWALALSTNDSNVMYGGFSTPVRVLRSDDHGINWTDLPFPITLVDAAVYLAIDPYDHDIVYAGVLNYGFFKTTDGGQTWRDINAGIPSSTRRMKAIAVNPQNPENIFVGMEDNTPFDGESDLIYVTEDGGEHWSRFSSGLPHAGHIRGLSIDPRELKVLAGVNSAEGSGIYQLSPLASATTQQMDGLPTSLFQNSPNPFNAETTIRFNLTQRSKVKLSVFSIPGELVKVLINSEMEPGSHLVRFDANGLATGVYLYTLETGFSRNIRRMILLR